jgi:hypothetical protein
MEYYKKGGSDKHLRDITGILKVSGRDVDREYIITWAKKMGLMNIVSAQFIFPVESQAKFPVKRVRLSAV